MYYFKSIYFFIVLGLVSCNKPSLNRDGSKIESVTVKSSSDISQDRVDFKNEVISLYEESTSLLFKGARNRSVRARQNSDLQFTLVSDVTTPVIGSTSLQATDIIVIGNIAYVSYNVSGATQMGAIESINIQDKEKPVLISRVEFPNTDINAMTLKDNFLYYVGATSNTDSLPSIIQKITVADGVFSNTVLKNTLPSYAGVDIALIENSVLAVSGDTGGLSIFNDSDLSLNKFIEMNDTRSVTVDKNYAYLLKGTNGSAYKYSGDYAEVVKNDTIGGATIKEHKATISARGNIIATALSDGGLKLLCARTLEEIGSLDAISVSGIDTSLTVTNAASFEKGLLFVANGEAGVYVYSYSKGSKRRQKAKCKDRTLYLEGFLPSEAGISANHIVYEGGYLFVANGLGAMRIIHIENHKASKNHDREKDDDDDDDSDDEDYDSRTKSRNNWKKR